MAMVMAMAMERLSSAETFDTSNASLSVFCTWHFFEASQSHSWPEYRVCAAEGHGKTRWLWSMLMDYEVGIMDYGVWIMEYGVRSMDYGLWSMEYGVWSMEYVMAMAMVMERPSSEETPDAPNVPLSVF